MPLFFPVPMRKADPRHPDYHLLEELAKPQASLNAGRVSVFVYHDGPAIREVVVAGHAEPITCTSVTSILIEAAKLLDDHVQWMLTCGAAYFRVTALEPTQANYFYGFESVMQSQNVLSQMIQALQQVAEEKGLVRIVHENWERLDGFRQGFRGSVSVQPAEIVLPDPQDRACILDYLPVVPGRNAFGEPLTFHLEGWEYDSPGFQAVADRHLRKVRRELLRDALRRRRTYRAWLKEWTEGWVERLNWLPRFEAEAVTLHVPGSDTMPPVEVSAAKFMAEHAASFLDRGQRWHRSLATMLARMPYGLATAAELDEKRIPLEMTEIDFQRLEKHTRPGNAGDMFTLRERITESDPRMISTCLGYIRQMDSIIAPYEELRSGKPADRSSDPGRAREMRIIDAISKRIVIETMIRGWPSVYLDDKADQEAFDEWASEYRPKVWAILARQARAKGIALDVLFEDNVVYDVRFDDDLGCVIQPLMLVDDVTHAQVHGSRTGASVAIPLWPRRTSHCMPQEVLALAPRNRYRAARLIAEARTLSDSAEVAAKMRAALACHPAEAGKLILAEWYRCLGRDTSAEFAVAQNFIEAAEFLRKGRNDEARRSIEKYLRDDPRPVPDAYVIAALSRLHRNDQAVRDGIKKDINDAQSLAKRHDDLLNDLRRQDGRGWLPSPTDVNALMRMKTELDRLTAAIDKKTVELKRDDAARLQLIELALRSPSSVRKEHPELAAAAERAHELLTEVHQNGGVYAGGPGLRRYGDTRRVIEVRGLLEILFTLGNIAYEIEKDANKAREKSIDRIKSLTTALWLPNEIESDLRHIAEEFSKGKWDRLQAFQMVSLLQQAIAICQSRMQDLLSSSVITGVPLKETIATRIHVTQTLEFKYRTALLELLGAKIAFGNATSNPWIVLDEELREFPEDGRFVFDRKRGIVSVTSSAGKTALLKPSLLTADDVAVVERTLADEDLPNRLNRFSPFLAEALLAAEVEACGAWRVWRDAMASLEDELIAALSSFAYEANLLPEYAPPFSEDKAFEERMDGLLPRTRPTIDGRWPDLGAWQKLTGDAPKRRALRARFV